MASMSMAARKRLFLRARSQTDSLKLRTVVMTLHRRSFQYPGALSQMHEGNDFYEIRSHPVDHTVRKMRYPALPDIALDSAVSQGMPLDATKRLFEIVQEALREAMLLL